MLWNRLVLPYFFTYHIYYPVFLVINIFSNFEGSPLRYIRNLWEAMWNVGLQSQRLSLIEPHVTLGNSRAGHWYFLVSQKFFSNVKDILQIYHFRAKSYFSILNCSPNLRNIGKKLMTCSLGKIARNKNG